MTTLETTKDSRAGARVWFGNSIAYTKTIKIWHVSVPSLNLPGKINRVYIQFAKQCTVSFLPLSNQACQPIGTENNIPYVLEEKTIDYRLHRSGYRWLVWRIREDTISIVYFYFAISIVDKTAVWCTPCTSWTVSPTIDKTQFQALMPTQRLKVIIRQQSYCQYSILRVLTKMCPL